MKLEHLSLILGLTKNELRRRLELGLIDAEVLNKQVSEYSRHLKLDALCDSWHEKQKIMNEIDPYQLQNEEQL